MNWSTKRGRYTPQIRQFSHMGCRVIGLDTLVRFLVSFITFESTIMLCRQINKYIQIKNVVYRVLQSGHLDEDFVAD